MNQLFHIKPAFEKDIPLIRELCYKVWPQTYASILPQDKIDYMLELMYSEDSLRQQMQKGAEFIFVYEGDEPVGFASYQEIKPSVFKLHKIYVLPSQQGKGTGRFVIDEIIKTILPLGAATLELQVNRNNKAKGFYEKLGFFAREEINLDIGGGFFMDDYIMEKQLTGNN